MENTDENSKLLSRYIPIANMIVENFGKHCEVVIHNFNNINSSLVYIKGNVTGRKIGAPITNIILKQLRKYGDDAEDMLGFITRTKDGKFIKTSISFIRNENGKIIGCIGINFDITAFAAVNQIISDFSKTNDFNKVEWELELYENNIEEIFETMIQMTLESIGKPVNQMKREEKQLFVKQLEKKGVLLIQGAIDRISDVLSVSKQTVYNYLGRDVK